MASSISEAFKANGVKIPPLNYRCWMWLFDHPDKTSREVALALKAKTSDVSSALSNMVKRGMVSERISQKPHSHVKVAHYSVIGKVFELKPMPKAPSVAAPWANDPLTYAPLPINFPPIQLPVPASAKPMLDTVREAYAMYLELHKIFGKNE